MQQLEFDFSDEEPTRPNFATRTSEDDAYITELESRLTEATLHPGYIAKAGPEAQQAMDYATQLVELQRLYAQAVRTNESLIVTNDTQALQIKRLKSSLSSLGVYVA